MVPATPAPYTPSESHASFMMLPTNVDGFIDLKTLADIHRFLSQSASDDDLALAAWVKDNYLYEPINVDGREIRTTEGFSKLDRAYRRVRSLTNKAQDKWPFFDRAWKSMSSTTVKNNARGEAAPGVSLLGMNNATHDSPMINGQDARGGANPPAPGFVSFGPNKPVRRMMHRKQTFQNLMPNTPVPLPDTKRELLEASSEREKQAVLVNESESESRPQLETTSTKAVQDYTDTISRSGDQQPKLTEDIEPGGVQAPFEELKDRLASVSVAPDALANSSLPTPTREDTVQDASPGKTRGNNGRFMPTENSLQPKRLGKRDPGKKESTKGTTKTREATTDQGQDEAESSSPASGQDVDQTMVDAPSTPAPTDDGKSDAQNGIKSENVPTAVNVAPVSSTTNNLGESSDRSPSESTNILSDDMSPYSVTLEYSLAAEAEPVSSNLDRLPPNSLRKNNKRKIQSKAPDGGPPRKRGRPRLSEQRRLEVESETQKEVAVEQVTAPEANTFMKEEVPKIATRRSTRQSAAANTDAVSPAQPTLQEPAVNEQPKETEEQKDKTMVDIGDEDPTACHQTSPLASAQAPAKSSSSKVTRAKSHALTETPTPNSKNTSSGIENIDLLPFGLSKTSSTTKRSKRSKPQTLGPTQDLGALINGTNKAHAETVIESTDRVLETPTLAPKPELVNDTRPAPLAKGTAAPESAVKVEYFARIHISTGVQDVPVALDDIKNDETVQKYAEWIEKEGIQIPYPNFKSIFGFAKKG